MSSDTLDTYGRGIKQDHAGGATLKLPQHTATHPHSTSTTLVPPFGTNHRQDVPLQRSQASPRPRYPTMLCGSWFRQGFSTVVNSIFHV